MAQTKERRKQFKHLGVEISNEFYYKIEEQAKKENISKSELARTAIIEYISRR